MLIWGTGLNPASPAGYDYDYINSDVLVNLMKVSPEGRLILPGGMSYAMLVLPNTDKMTLPVLKKLNDLVKAGATIIGPRPEHTPGYTNYPDSEEKLNAIASALWGAGNWRNYREDPSQSPVDGHMLVALMAPRPLLLQMGDTDNWSDPKGEFIAAAEGGKVYEFLGKKALGTNVWPAADEPIQNDLGYFMHKGGHGALPSDYPVFIKFIKMHF